MAQWGFLDGRPLPLPSPSGQITCESSSTHTRASIVCSLPGWICDVCGCTIATWNGYFSVCVTVYTEKPVRNPATPHLPVPVYTSCSADHNAFYHNIDIHLLHYKVQYNRKRCEHLLMCQKRKNC